MAEHFCPKCGGTRFHREAWPNPIIAFWVLNPVTWINEVLLGQRIPREILYCQTCDEPKYRRQYVACPSCGALHPGMLWSGRNAFGHWFGYACPSCGGAIPCLWNVFSRLILAVTFPIWILSAKALRQRWLAWENERLKAAQRRLAEGGAKVKWVRLGVLGFGTLVWVALSGMYVISDAMRGRPLDVHRALWNIPLCAAAGLAWGLIMKAMLGRKPRSA